MSKLYRTIVWLILFTLITACAAPPTVAPTKSLSPVPQITQSPTEESLPPVKIDRHPDTAYFGNLHSPLTSIPKFDPNATEPLQIDIRSMDLTKVNMTGSLADLMFADFDSQTQWPNSALLPVGFDPQQIMEIGKDPGLGMRALHEQGITGKGVGIAIIDQTLLVDHVEYKDRIQVYEEPELADRGMYARMHGPAVASIAVGKTVGVAPEANLYYLASPTCFNYDDFACLARSVRRIIEINKTLPPDHKIRVLSISRGWVPTDNGYADIMAAVKEAATVGIFVISSSLGQTDELYFHGLGRDPLVDPNQFESYVPGLWWEKNFYSGIPLNGYQGNPPKQTLLVPMDSRTTASPTGTSDYAFYREGGWSWVAPYLAGTYALAAQVKPDITSEVFWETALKTGKTVQIQHDGKSYELGVILDPQALIAALKAK